MNARRGKVPEWTVGTVIQGEACTLIAQQILEMDLLQREHRALQRRYDDLLSDVEGMNGDIKRAGCAALCLLLAIAAMGGGTYCIWSGRWYELAACFVAYVACLLLTRKILLGRIR